MANEQLSFDFTRDAKKKDGTSKTRADYEIEAAMQMAHQTPTKPTDFHEWNAENDHLLSDEERSDMLLAEQEYLEDLREERAEQAAKEKAAKEQSAKEQANSIPDSNKQVKGESEPKLNKKLPAGYTNTFPIDEKGNMVDDGWSFDEKDDGGDGFGM